MSQPDAPTQKKKTFFDRFDLPQTQDNKYTEVALTKHKSEGLFLAVRTRWVALSAIAVLIVFVNPVIEVLYYHFVLSLFALNGWFMCRVGRVGQSRAELALIFVDLALLTITMILPNPFAASDLPLAMQFRFGNFVYFYVFLAAGTLAYSWRTMIAIGTWTAVMWGIGVGVAWWVAEPDAALSDAARTAFSAYPRLAEFLDPNEILIGLRLQEAVVFLIVAVILAFTVRRFNMLLLNNAALERERVNLSRYFSPNVVEELSHNDEPLKQIRTHDVAVLFIDIVDFTSFSEGRDPKDVIELLRGFHGRMESEVFRFDGTLDKYLGDGLMATFGTPFVGENDATRALDCARAMTVTMEIWNAERRLAGEPEIHFGIGLHYGTVVLGDIGANRLEFAVIGNTVNVSNRLEALTRSLKVRVVISDALRDQVLRESTPALEGFERIPNQSIRGISEKLTIWTMK